MNELNMQIGKRIAQLRNLKGMTQEKLAEKLNISIKHCSSVERGASGLSLEKLIQLCELFDISMDYLICGKNNDTLPVSITNLINTNDPKEQQLLREYLLFYQKIHTSKS